MALDRTWYNSLVDDDGSNTVGTLWDKAAVDHLMDNVDAEIVRLDADIAAISPVAFVFPSTVTGTQNDWVHGCGEGNGLVEWSGAADAAFTGMKSIIFPSAANVTGQIITIKNTGTKVATFAHQSGSSTAGFRFYNPATSAPTPIAAGGWISYQYDGTDWRVVAHEQGAWIASAYSAANYTAQVGTWTVEAGDVLLQVYRLSGRTLTVQFTINTTTVSASTSYLSINAGSYGGFVFARTFESTCNYWDNGTTVGTGMIRAASTAINVYRSMSGSPNWSIATNSTYMNGQVSVEIT